MGYTTPSIAQVDDDPLVIQITTQPHIPTTRNQAGGTVSSAFGSLADLGVGLLDGAITAISQLGESVSTPSLTSVGSLDADTSIDASPSAPNYLAQQGAGFSGLVGIDYNEDPYVSSLLDVLKTSLFNSLATGGVGLSATAETAIQDNGAEAEILLKQDEVDKAASEWAERSMNIPDGELAFAVTKIETVYQGKQLDRSRKIIAESQKLAIENTRLFIEEAKKCEKSLMDYFSRREDRKVEKATAMVKASMGIADALIRYYGALADVDKHNATMYSAYVGALSSIAVSTANLQAALMGARADFVAADAQVQEAQAEIDLQASLLSGMIAGAQAQAKAALAGGAMSAIHVGAHVSAGEHVSEGTVSAVADAAIY